MVPTGEVMFCAVGGRTGGSLYSSALFATNRARNSLTFLGGLGGPDVLLAAVDSPPPALLLDAVVAVVVVVAGLRPFHTVTSATALDAT